MTRVSYFQVMDLRGYTTLDEVGEDPQVRNVENFRPTTAAEEIEYLNKILENMENCDSKENSKSELAKFESSITENDSHSDTYNNNALDLITEMCSESLNAELCRSACEPNFFRDESNDNLEQLSESCSFKEILEKQKSDDNEIDISEYGLPCADDILTQAENQHSVIQDIKSGHVQNELSTEPNLIMAEPAIPDVDNDLRLSPGCTQSKSSPKGELEDKLEAHSIEPVSSDAQNETGSSELSSSTKEATIMPVNCSSESSSVLESRHYSAKEAFDFISGEDVSGSSTLDSLELGDVPSLSNVVLGDIGSLLESSADQSDITDENTPAEYETHIDLSIVKSEPACADPGENFDMTDFCNDPGEEFVVKESSIKDEPVDYSPPVPTMNQEEVLLPVKIFKNEDDSSDDQVIMPNIRYLVEEKKEYSREEVAAALIISQSSLSPTIDMEMFQNLGRTKLVVSSSRLEDMLKRPKRLTLEDYNAVQLFRSNYGSSLKEWKVFFKFRGNYSAKHTARKNVKKQTDNVSVEKRKGKRGRKKKCETVSNEEGNTKLKSVEKEEKVFGNEANDSCGEHTKTLPVKKEMKLEQGTKDTDSYLHEGSSKINVAPNAQKGKRGRKKKSLMEKPDSSTKCSPSVKEKELIKVERGEAEPGDSAYNEVKDEPIPSVPIKEEKSQLKQMNECERFSTLNSDAKPYEDVSRKKKRKKHDQIDDEHSKTVVVPTKSESVSVKSEHTQNKIKTIDISHQLSSCCKACSVHLYDIAKDPTYGITVRNLLKENSGNKVLDSTIKMLLEDWEDSPAENVDSDDGSDESFRGFSPVKKREEEDLGTKYSVKKMEPATSVKKEKAFEKSQVEVVSEGVKDEPNQDEYGENTEIISKQREEIGAKHREETGEKQREKIRAEHREDDETEVILPKEDREGNILKKEEDIQCENVERRARKRLKLDNEDFDEKQNIARDKKFAIEDFSIGVSDENQEKEDAAVKSDIKRKDEAHDVLYDKKLKEEISPKDRNPASSSLPALSTFR